MNNPFKKILYRYDVPEVLKQKVLNDINLIKLNVDIADLFLLKYSGNLGGIIDTNNELKNDL